MNVPDNGPKIEAVSLALCALAILSVASRFYRRLFMAGSGVGVDDVLIAAAIMLSIGRSVMEVISVENFGLGKHEADLPRELRLSNKTALIFWIAQILYKSCVLATKESICFLYLRIFNVGHKRFRKAVYTSIVLIGLYYLISILVTIFECSPVHKSWKKKAPGKCINLTNFFYANAGFNILTDLIIMALPIPLVAKLQVNLRQRIGLGLLFFVGSIATATSIARLFSIQQGGKPTDVSWNTSYSTTWSAVEINVAITCACLPILRAPIQAMFPKIFGSRKKSSTSSTPGDIPSGQGPWSRISASNSKRQSHLVSGSKKKPMALELESLPVDGHIKKKFGEDCSKNEEERYILSNEEQDIGVARDGLDAEMGIGLGKEGIVKTTDIDVDYRKT